MQRTFQCEFEELMNTMDEKISRSSCYIMGRDLRSGDCTDSGYG